MELTKEQKIALELLSKSLLRDRFYWTGGTLLSVYYFQHRYSLDLDLFTEKEFTFEEVNSLANDIKKKLNIKEFSFKRINDRYEFLFKNEKNLRVEFVLYNHEKETLKKRKKYLGVYIDSLEDIAANKFIALLDRKEPKDLFDIYYILTKGKISIKKLISLAKKKFGVYVSEDQLWSRANFILPELINLKPLMIGSENKRNSFINKIDSYFKKNSRNYLNYSFE